MIAVPNAIVTAAIGLIFLSILVSGVVLKRKGKDFAGEDPVHPVLYRTGKACSFLVWIALLDAAAVLFIPSVLVLVPSVVAIYVHHRIILAEEAHMVKTWGDEYMKYMKTVRRYA